MPKTKTPDAEAVPEKKRSPLEAFVYHQGKALEETGKAFVSLLPKDFRTHTANAIDESKASFEILANGVLDTVECGLEKLRGKPGEDEGKVKVEVE